MKSKKIKNSKRAEGGISKKTSSSLSSSIPKSTKNKGLRCSTHILKRSQIILLPFCFFQILFFGIQFHKGRTGDSVVLEVVGVGSMETSLEEFSKFGQQLSSSITTGTSLVGATHRSNVCASDKKPTKKEAPKQNISDINRTQIDTGMIIETTFEDSTKTINFQYNQSYENFYNIPSDGNNLWDDTSSSSCTSVFHIEPTSNIPKWMKDYLNWHKSKLKELQSIKEPSNITEAEKIIESERWIIMQCLHYDRKCGGTADRLKPILYMLRVAYESRRILFIRWERPNLLEEFLVPPIGGIDWRVPPWLATTLRNATIGRRFVPNNIIRRYAYGDLPLVRTRYQSYNGGSEYYNTRLGYDELDFAHMFSTVWNIFFTPSPKVQQRIAEELDTYQLVPHQYTAAHLRALYGIKDRSKPEIRTWAMTSLSCASHLTQAKPKSSNYKIFFTSDSDVAIEYSEVVAADKKVSIVNRRKTTSPYPPLHLDKPRDWNQRPVSDFYDTFIDLYMIALGGCVFFNKGGFGHWGLLIGGNLTCTHPIANYRYYGGGGRPVNCRWNKSFPQNNKKKNDRPLNRTKAAELFLPEMEYRWNVTTTT